MKKWAKRIFNNSSSKQNAAGAGAPGPPPSVQQLVMSVPNNVPLKAPAIQLQHPPPAQPHPAQFNPVVQAPIPDQPPFPMQPPPPAVAMQGPAVPPPSQLSTIPMSHHPQPPPPGPIPGHPSHPIPPGYPKPEVVVHTSASATASNVAATAPSTVGTTAAGPPAPHRLSSPTTGQSAPITNQPLSYPHTAPPAPTANGVPGPVAAGNAQVPRPYMANGTAGATGPGLGHAPPGAGRWQTASVDYSGGDWGVAGDAW